MTDNLTILHHATLRLCKQWRADGTIAPSLKPTQGWTDASIDMLHGKREQLSEDLRGL